MSGTPFQTKFTLGLLTIEPCPLDDNIDCEIEHTSNDITAEHELAKAAIAAKKKAKKIARQKSRSSSPGTRTSRTKSRSLSPNSNKKKEETLLLRKKQLAEEREAKNKAKEEEETAAKKIAQEKEAAAKKLAQEEEEKEAAKKAAELKMQQEEEEAEEERALAEFAALAEKEEQARLQAQGDASMDASMAFQFMEDPPIPKPTCFRPKRRISMFPACKSNVGLNQAIRRYGSDVPFDWEKPEWTKEHIDLKHTSTINNTYGWEKPDWTRRSVLKKTMLGCVVKQGASLSRPSLRSSGQFRMYLTRRHSLTGRSSFDKTNQEFGWSQPEWARRNVLRNTEFGEAARQGANLAVPAHVSKTLASGGSLDDIGYHHMEDSFASLNASRNRMSIAWEKPSWAVNRSLKPTSTGAAVRQGVDLSLPAVGIREILMGDESARSRTRTRNGEHEKSPNNSFAALDYSDKNQHMGWEKPAWAKMSLKRTSKGEKMKTTGTLANPITPRRTKSHI